MFSDETVRAAAEVVVRAQERLVARITDGRLSDEPAMTAALMADPDQQDRLLPRGQLTIRVLDSAGASSSEAEIGADMCVILDLKPADGVRVTKGFLVQAKRSGRSGLYYDPEGKSGASDFSHWTYRGVLRLLPSGTVRVGKPDRLLLDQCAKMLAVTPSSFVWVYGEHPVAVVGAPVVQAAGSRPGRALSR